jgi:3-oxoacyl-[acyl-carrier-protein] synthase II
LEIERVAITGIGVISPGAIGAEAFGQLLRSGEPAVKTIERFETGGLKAGKAGLLTEFKPREFIAVARMRRMNMLSRIAMASARLALDDSGFAERGYGRNEAGVAVGTMFGPVQTSLDYMKEYVERGAALAPPQLFAESVANAPGSHLAIEHGFEGFNITFTQRESSFLSALMYAASQIVKGTLPAALAVGVDELSEMTYGVLDRIGALAHANDSGPEEMRPFDRSRNGMTVGEGGVCLTLEKPGTAAAWCEISGFGMSRDTTASISDWGSDAGAVRRAMQGAIDDAGLTTADIDAVFASANGSVKGDRLEGRALVELFGERMPPVVAAKPYFGEYAGASGLHLAAAALALREQFLPVTPGFSESDALIAFQPNLELRQLPLRHLLVNSVSAGGGVVAAVLSRSSA